MLAINVRILIGFLLDIRHYH